MIIDVGEALRKVVREELEPILQELKTIKTPQVQTSFSGWHRASEICAIKGISPTTFHRIKEQISMLSDEDAGILIKAIFEYEGTSVCPELPILLRLIYQRFAMWAVLDISQKI